MNQKYCASLTTPVRVQTLEVNIGNLKLGAQHPIRIQSMTTADTMDTQKSVDEAIRMINAGCELIRLTAPSKLEAENLANIRSLLHEKQYFTPLVADIHFTPNAAEIAAKIVEKVRINPGNYADKKKFAEIDYTPESYQAELDRIEKKFKPLIEICKKHGTAMRIGTNHGSLSDRIMSYFGDSPEGMVQSALEFLDICEKNDFLNLVISMKSSNVQVMVYAYRLLMNRLFERKNVYPVHLGVTEAGEGEDGRIKSAMGIGTLLADGIGDTIRVSLTEAPEFEMPVAQYIIQFFNKQHQQFSDWLQKNNISKLNISELSYNPFEFNRRRTKNIEHIGSHEVPRIIADFSNGLKNESDLAQIGYFYNAETDKWTMTDAGADFIFLQDSAPKFMLPTGLRGIVKYDTWKKIHDKTHIYPYFSDLNSFENSDSAFCFIELTVEWILKQNQKPNIPPNAVLVLHSDFPAIQVLRSAIGLLDQWEIDNPLIFKTKINPDQDLNQSWEAVFQLTAACVTGPLLVDGRIDGLWLNSTELFSSKLINQTAFTLLQASRLRMTKTEYISCPSCGRTLFDLQETTAMIRKRTEHLKGVKIGIMGCIVNGPGEMADADFGYVGSGPGIITLYRGKEIVERAVKTEEAVDKLIELIKNEGMWIEPK